MHNVGIKTCWIISDGKAGAENQSLGLADALGVKPVIKRIVLRQPWKPLVPWFRFGLKYAFSEKSAAISPPWPDLLISSGRQSTAASFYVKSQNPRTITVQIQSPGISSRHFDLLVTPRHDNIDRFICGSNVIRTKGALHRVTPERLAFESEKFSYLLKNDNKKRIAVLIGGTNLVSQLTPVVTAKLCENLLRLQESEKVILLITASRRTGIENIATLETHIKNKPDIVFLNPFDNKENSNPYYGFLGLADAIIVTSDSVSMISEACATGKPVYIFHLPSLHSKFNVFHQELLDAGITRVLDGKIEEWHYPPLDDMTIVVKRVKELCLSQSVL